MARWGLKGREARREGDVEEGPGGEPVEAVVGVYEGCG